MKTLKIFQSFAVGGGVYGNDGLVVEIGHNYRLSFEYDNVPVTAETTVPTLPENVAFSSTSIEVMSFMPKPMSKAPQDGIEISWTNDDRAQALPFHRRISITSVLTRSL